MRDHNNTWYADVNPARLIAQVESMGSVEEVHAAYYAYSQTVDSLTKALADARAKAAKPSAKPERDDADIIIATTQRVSSVWYASRELGVSQAAIRKIFKRRGLPIPKLDKERLKKACLVGGAKRRARTEAARQPVSVYRRPVQLSLFGQNSDSWPLSQPHFVAVGLPNRDGVLTAL